MKRETIAIEVFRTNITSERKAALLKARLLAICPDFEIDFDLQDCDHILRIVGDVQNDRVIEIAKELEIFVAPL